jgi:hypothetical protein
MLDAMGRLSLQHLSAQLHDSNSSIEERASSVQPAWYNCALQLPGQFLSLSSLPMPPSAHAAPTAAEGSTAPPAVGEMLTACSLDGWTYFIPTLPMELPPRPIAAAATPASSTGYSADTVPANGWASAAASVACAVSSSGSDNDGMNAPSMPFTLSRFHFPSRVSAFCSGLYSASPGGPAAGALCFVTYQHELVLFPDVLGAAPVREWSHRWAWELNTPSANASSSPSPPALAPGAEEDAILAGADYSMSNSSGSSMPQTPAVPMEGVASPSNATPQGVVSPRSSAEGTVVSAQPSYTLTVRSTRHTLLDGWREADKRAAQEKIEASGNEVDEKRLQQPQQSSSVTSLQKLVEWTTSATPPHTPQRRASRAGGQGPTSSSSSSSDGRGSHLASYVRDLRSADMVLLQEYRALLRRRLGLDESPDAATTESEQQYRQSQQVDEGAPRVPLNSFGVRTTGTRTPVSPAPPSAGIRAGGGGSGGGSMSSSPAAAGLLSPALSSSPLFSSFKLTTQHFPLRPLALDGALGSDVPASSSAAAPSSSTVADRAANNSRTVVPATLVRVQTDPVPSVEGVNSTLDPRAAVASGLDSSPAFWRKLMRRTQ